MPNFRAAARYFAIVFAAGFVLGTLRTLLIAPAIGNVLSVTCELPFMLGASWWACGAVLRNVKIASTAASHLTMGLEAFALLLAAEGLLSMTLTGLSLREHFALYETLPVQIGLAGQMAYALFPLIRFNSAKI